jgi:hypothetical protein
MFSAGRAGFMRSLGKIGVNDARQRAAGGEQFVGMDGQPIDVNSMPDDMALVAVGQGGNLFYVPVSQAEKQVRVGNNVIAVPEFNLPEATTGGGTVLGPAQVPTTSTTGIPAIDLRTGKMTTIPRTTTRVPGRMEIPSRGGAPAAAPAAVPPSLQRPTTTTKTTPVKRGTPGTGKVAKPSPDEGPLSGPSVVPITQYNTYAKTARSVILARNAVLGPDPNQLTGLSADMSVYDDPESVKRLSRYIGFINNRLAEEAAVPTGSGPMTALEWYVGMPTAITGLQQDAISELALTLNPLEQ